MICQCLVVYIIVIHLYILYTHTHTHIFYILFHYDLLQDIDDSSHAVQYDLVIYPFYIEWFASANSKLSVHSPHPTSPLATTSLFFVGEFVSV